MISFLPRPVIHAARAWRRLPGDRNGATAVEFGLVCLPFLSLLCALIQTSLMIWAQQNLDNNMQKTVRTLFTGEFQTANSSTSDAATLLAALKKGMCGSGAGPSTTVFDCSAVKIDVTLGNNFASSTPTSPISPATKDWAPGFGTHYSCASPGAIVIATAAVKFPVFFGAMSAPFSDFSDGSKLLQSTAVFRTEPYGTSTC